jgi:hypothetical protein
MTLLALPRLTSYTPVQMPPHKQALLDMIGFTPTGPEQAGFLASDCPEKAAFGGEQGGKSEIVSADCILHLPDDLYKCEVELESSGKTEGVIIWLVGRKYGNTRKEFQYVSSHLLKMYGKHSISISANVDPGQIKVRTGDPAGDITISTKSADNPMDLSMEGPHGIVLCEAGQLDIETWNRVQLRRAPKDGWISASGTLENIQSVGWWPSLKAAWASGTNGRQSFTIPSYTNIHVYPGGVNDPKIIRIKKDTSDDFYLQRIMGEIVPPSGLVYKEFNPLVHVREVEYEPNYEELFLWEDPGYGDSAHALLVAQKVKRETPAGHIYEQWQVFDEFYETGFVHPDVIDHVKETKWAAWWDKAVKTLISDPNYVDQHHSMSSIAEMWMQKARLYTAGKKSKIKPGLECVKRFLKVDPVSNQPGIVFSPRCKGLLSEFGSVPHPLTGPKKDTIAPYMWSLDNDGNIVGEVPVDKNNHALDALRYGLMHESGYVLSEGTQKITVQRF